MVDANLTERQRKWFASIRQGLERDTGKTLAEWVAVARSCPETGHRAQLRWFKQTHGLLQNRASLVLAAAFGGVMGWSEPDILIEALWMDSTSRAILDAVTGLALQLPGTILTARKGYTAWSRTVQYAAMRPLNGGRAVLGLAVDIDSHPSLTARGSQSWSERLTSKTELDGIAAVDETIAMLLERAWAGA